MKTNIPLGQISLDPTPEMLRWEENMKNWLLLEKPIYSKDLVDLNIKEKTSFFDITRLEDENALMDDLKMYRFRERFISQFGFVILTQELIDKFKGHGPFVEIGAGSGALSKLLSINYMDVIATDLNEVSNYSFSTGMWFTIEHKSAIEALEFYPNRTAIFAWPEMDSWAGEALLKALPAKVIYIGEHNGCTGDALFHKTLEEYYDLIEEHRICNFPNIKDNLTIWVKK